MYSHTPLQRVVVEAPAKINPFLDIAGRREDGYHLLETVMQAVSLSDLVIVGRRETPGIRVTCSREGIPEDGSNLAHRAAAAFLAAAGLPGEEGLHIHIDKRIPHEAGLGGGSSDAAAVLAGLNRLWGTRWSSTALERLGLALGADVPFALRGGCVLARGVGEAMTPLHPGLPDCPILLAKPPEGVSTPEAYRRYDACSSAAHRSWSAMEAAILSRDPAACGEAMFNAFEQVCSGEDTARIRAVMREQGAFGAALSGSGSAVAGLFPGLEAAGCCADALEAMGMRTWITRPVGEGCKVIHAA